MKPEDITGRPDTNHPEARDTKELQSVDGSTMMGIVAAIDQKAKQFGIYLSHGHEFGASLDGTTKKKVL